MKKKQVHLKEQVLKEVVKIPKRSPEMHEVIIPKNVAAPKPKSELKAKKSMALVAKTIKIKESSKKSDFKKPSPYKNMSKSLKNRSVMNKS